ncbi:MAG: tRNA lysidine(34) synthetase TilS [Acidobacteria bacterium]|nr:tRNA lysidine(34) synthetase TilS [Acidobacteriota bacterium]
MTKLEKKLRASLIRLGVGLRSRDTKSSEAEPRIVVAVSGGADSTALFDALARLCERGAVRATVLAAHLNHQLRGEESEGDDRFVRDMAARMGAPIFIERIDVDERARAEKRNLEATARRLRYDFLRRMAEQNNAEYVLTAHTHDDQAETILMRLLRGAGAEGLRGIHETLALGERSKLIRPMLKVTRGEVIAHCEYHGLGYRVDASNLDPDFTRNRIRHELLPLLRDFNPSVEDALSRAAGLLAMDDAYLSSLAAERFNAVDEGGRLNLASLFNLAPTLRRRVLRLWLKAQCDGLRRIELSHIEALDDLVARGQSGRRIELPGDLIVAREFDYLKLIRRADVSPAPLEPARLKDDASLDFGDFRFTLEREVRRKSLELYNGEKRELFAASLRECEELGELRLRTRYPGDAYVPVGAPRVVKLKTLMIRRKIPISQRDKYPILVTAGDRIVWTPGLPVAREFAPDAGDQICALVVAEKLR